MIAAEAAAKADFKAVDPERKAAKREEATAKAGYDDLVEFNRASMEATLKASEAMLKATSLITEELTSFACQRLRTDMETGRSLMSPGTDWGQAIDLQGKFAADAVRDYLEELTKITQLAAQTTRDVWSPLQELSTQLARGALARSS